MTLGAESQDAAASHETVPARRPVSGRVVVTLLRASALLGLLTALALGAVAGLFTTGDVEMLDWHSVYATVLAVLVVIQLVAALLLWRANRWLWWPGVVAVLVVVMVVAQMGLGDSRVLSLHMPLGIAIATVEGVLAFWAFGLRVRRAAAARGAAEAEGETV